MNNKYYLYGVPGVGKTYFSQRLAEKTGFQLIELDTLRKVAQNFETREQNPFVYLGTSEAYSEFGNNSRANIIKGLKSVRKAMFKYVLEKLNSLENSYIAEGAFIDPNNLVEKTKGILVVQLDEQQHFEQFFKHRDKSQHNIASFQIVLEIQDFLIKEAESLDVSVIESGDNINAITEM